MRIILLCILISVLIVPVCSAQNAVHQVEDSMGMDKWVHVGAGYIVNDQLKRQTELTVFERFLVITTIAYAKERWADAQFDHADFAATVAGGLIYEAKF